MGDGPAVCSVVALAASVSTVVAIWVGWWLQQGRQAPALFMSSSMASQ